MCCIDGVRLPACRQISVFSVFEKSGIYIFVFCVVYLLVFV